MDKAAQELLNLAYTSEDQDAFNQSFKGLITTLGVQKNDVPKRLEQELKTNRKAYPKTSQEALRFLTYFPLPVFRKTPIFDRFLFFLTPEDKKKIPTPTGMWGDQKFLKAGVSPHAQECNVIALDASEKDCNCGKPPTIIEQLVLDAHVTNASPLNFNEPQKKALYAEGANFTYSMSPMEFIELTTLDEGDIRDIERSTEPLDTYNQDKDKEEYPYLHIRKDNGKIMSHEGRHRAMAVLRNGEPDFVFGVVLTSHAGIPLEDATKADMPKKLIGQFDESKTHKVEPSKLEDLGGPVTAGMLDFPRKRLPESVWLYGDDPLPRLQPKLRAKILSEARHKLSKFGAKMIGCMLYGGAATYQYHEGGDIDCSVYIDWDSFKGTEDILQDAFKTVEIPWDKYVVHLFVKPSNQTEQIEVADAYYNVLKDEWELPPLVLPKDFDPEVFFKPLVEMAEKKAQKIDLMMGEVSREWSRLKKCLRALKEGARDEAAVKDRAEITRSVLLDKIDNLCSEFVAIWKARKKLHDQLRQKYINDRNIGRFERFQFPEVCWKYLDEMGYVEFLKVLAKAQESGVIRNLLEQATPQLPDNLPEMEVESD